MIRFQVFLKVFLKQHQPFLICNSSNGKMLSTFNYEIFTIFKYDILFSMPKQLKIYTIEDKEEEKLLRKKSLPVDQEQLKEPMFREFLKDLLYSAQNSEEQGNVPSCGISAPQVGKNIRVFYILNYDTNEWQVFINPEVEPIKYTKIFSLEGCLSVPNREEEVMRYKKVKAKYLDKNGNWKTKKFKDYNAITIQHELDHLDGILFIDRIDRIE